MVELDSDERCKRPDTIRNNSRNPCRVCIVMSIDHDKGRGQYFTGGTNPGLNSTYHNYVFNRWRESILLILRPEQIASRDMGA